MLLGHVGGEKWLGDEAKTMSCTFMTLYLEMQWPLYVRASGIT